MAQLGEAAISADMHLVDGLLDVSEFGSGLGKPVEWNVVRVRLPDAGGDGHSGGLAIARPD